MYVFSSFWRTTGSKFYAASQRTARLCQQIHHHLCYIVRLQLPALLIARLITAKFSIHRSGHDVTDLDVIVPDLLHQRFTESVQAKLGSVVSCHLRMSVRARERGDVDDVTTTTLLHQWDGFMATVKNAKDIRLENGVKVFDTH